jgi:hypothetical protein
MIVEPATMSLPAPEETRDIPPVIIVECSSDEKARACYGDPDERKAVRLARRRRSGTP